MNLTWIVVENMLGTQKILAKPKYGEGPHIRREGLPYTCHITHIFEHFDISTEGYAIEHVKPTWVAQKESVKTMKIYKTKNRGFMFWPYL